MTTPVIESLMNHRSIRLFRETPVEKEKLDLVLHAGVRAATAGNLQTYSIVVIDEKETKKALLGLPENAPAFGGGSVWIAALVDLYRLKRWLELNGAPFFSDRIWNLLLGFSDAVAALQNMAAAAESLGLGTCYMSAILSADIRGALGAPEYVFPAGMICLGYAAETPETQPRLPLHAVVHKNRYSVPSDRDLKDYFKFKDEQWERRPAEERANLMERGIANEAQLLAVGHYTGEFIQRESVAIVDNLLKANFRLAGE